MSHDDEQDYFIFEYGRVQEVQPETLAVKCVIHSIDPDRVHDEWIWQAVPFVGKPGYGPAFAPAVGSEVLITGRYGQDYSLIYLSTYNTRFMPPSEFADGSRGMKIETALRFLVDSLLQLKSGQRVEVDSPDVFLQSGGSVSVHGQGERVGFLGADPIARRTLPPDAMDITTNNTLTNAIKRLLIDLGFAQ
jgi:hypothetical protein